MPASPTPTQIEVYRQLADPDKLLQEQQVQTNQLYAQASIVASRSRQKRQAAVANRKNEPPLIILPPQTPKDLSSDDIPIPNPPRKEVEPIVPPIRDHFPDETPIEENPKPVKPEEKPIHPSPNVHEQKECQKECRKECQKECEEEVDEVRSAREAWFEKQRQQQETKPSKKYWEHRGDFAKTRAMRNAGSAVVMGAKIIEGATALSGLQCVNMSGLEDAIEEAVGEGEFNEYIDEAIEVPWIAEFLGNSKFSAMATVGHIMANIQRKNMEKKEGGFQSNRKPKTKTQNTAPSMPTTQEQFETMMEKYEQRKKQQEQKQNNGDKDKSSQVSLEWEKRLEQMEQQMRVKQEEWIQYMEQKKMEFEQNVLSVTKQKEELKQQKEEWGQQMMLQKEQLETEKKELERERKNCEYTKDKKTTTEKYVEGKENKDRQKIPIENDLMKSKVEKQDIEKQKQDIEKQKQDPFQTPLPQESSVSMVVDAVTKTPRPTFSSDADFVPCIEALGFNSTKIQIADKLLSHMMQKKEEEQFQEQDPDALADF